jgi:hypothetical protein
MGAAQRSSEHHIQNRPYRCFLLRCWLEEGAGPGGGPAWRFAIRQAELNAARRSFASFHDVTEWIEAELAACERMRNGFDPVRLERDSECEDSQ